MSYASSQAEGTSLPMLPMTMAQRGMHVGHRIGHRDVVFNVAEAVEIHGPVDEACFLRALDLLALESEAARVRVVETADGPLLALMPHREGRFPLLDFSGEADPWAAAMAYMRREVVAPVDLERDVLWRWELLRLAQDRYVWFTCAHHVVMDGFTASLLSNRLAAVYNAWQRGEEPPPCDFGTLSDLVEEERAYRASERFERDRRFWREQLSDMPDPVSLSKRPTMGTRGLMRCTGQLSQATTEKLKAAALADGCTLPQALIAVVAAFFHRCTGVTDLVLGTPVAARTGRQLRRTPGMVANAVALRLGMSPEMTLEAVTRHVAAVMRQALKHQQFRVEVLRRELGLISRGQALARLSVNIEPFHYDLRFGEHRTTAHNLSNGSADDLTVFIYDRNDGRGLRFDFDANPSLYTEAELRTHVDRFTRLVERLSEAPQLPIGEVPLLDAAEAQVMHVLATGCERPLPAGLVSEWIEAEAARSPSTPAIADEDTGGFMTLGELNAAANGWARRLIDIGIGPGARVAVALPRDARLPIALLAVLKAGAAYVPIDPDLPAPRIAAMWEDAHPALLLTTSDIDVSMPLLPVPRLWVDLAQVAGAEDPVDADRPRPLEPDDPAYVIFTSGSTGRPKGVQVSHRSLVNLLAAMRDELRLGLSDRWMAVTTVSFDIAALEIFGPLISGGLLTLASRDTVRDPLRLVQCMRRQRINVMQATPSLWQSLVEKAPDMLSGMVALVGGEPLPPPLATALLACGARTVNLYGPTETTVWSTFKALGDEDASAPPIGRPIWNTQTYVLDGALQPVGVGVEGELYIGGMGVAEGYVGQLGLTAERFLPDPFDAPGSRMYRTGDIARWTEDGMLTCLGRADHQVKIRGHRIETGDVEAALSRCAGVQRALVTAQPGPGGALRLLAYCVPLLGATLDPQHLRQEVQAVLPEYMVPAVVVVMPTLPLTPNGKVDRKALPAPEAVALAPSELPRTPLEKELATLWAGVLQRDSVGLHDNFFELGGDSLAALALIDAIESMLGVPVPMTVMFETRTLAELVQRMESGMLGNPLNPLLPLREEGSAAPVFCVHPVAGLGWCFAPLLRHIGTEHPVYALQSLDPKETPAETVQAMARRYLQRIRQVQPQGPYHLVGWSFGGLVAYEMARLIEQEGDTVGLLSMLDSFPFVLPPGALDDEHTLARQALSFLGCASNAAEDTPQSLHALGRHLWDVYGVSQLPMVDRLERQHGALVNHAVRMIQHHLKLAAAYRPGRLSSDVLFFEAGRRQGTDEATAAAMRAQTWRPHVDGDLQVQVIDAHHQDLLEGDALAAIGQVLAQRLHASFRRSLACA